LERTSQFSEMPVAPQSYPAVPVSEVDEPRSTMPNRIELRGPSLDEQLHAIVGILDNQLILCSKPLKGNIDSCEPLLARAKTLCARLEAQVSATTRTNDEGPTTAVISAARELFQRFQEHAVKHSSLRARTA
jgi:hypothetical protein